MSNGATSTTGGPNQQPAPVRSGQPAGVPTSLVVAAAWSWRILTVAAAFLALLVLFNKLYLVVLPVFFALLLTALLHPVVAVLRRVRFPRALATWVAFIIAILVVGGIGWFVEQETASSYQDMVGQVQDLLERARGYVDQLPFANPDVLQQLQDRLIRALQDHASMIATGVISAGSLLTEAVTGVILMFFVTFFFLDEGDRIWSWVVRLLPLNMQPSVRGAGERAWRVLSGWIVGTAIIAAFHGVVIGVVMFLLGVPLAVPLAVLVFIGSFIPIIGAVVFGGLAVIVTLITNGWVAGLILLGVLLVENQVEAHLLQPFIVGRAVKLHPVAIALALTGGALISGVFGAILAIPIVAALFAAMKYLTGVEDLDGNVRRGDPNRLQPEHPPFYAPLPLYAAAPGSQMAVTNPLEDDSISADHGISQPQVGESKVSSSPSAVHENGESHDGETGMSVKQREGQEEVQPHPDE